MQTFRRYPPVALPGRPLKTQIRDNWEVVLEYADEAGGPHLVDLSHREKWDLQDQNVDRFSPAGATIPAKPGESRLENGFLVNRLNRIQASIWHLSGEPVPMPSEPNYTDTTESTVFLALIGEKIFSVMEKLTRLDFLDPALATPFVLQGPFSHVPCQMACLGREGEKSGVLFTCSRGYGKDMVDAILHAGYEFGLRTAGENRLVDWLKAL